MSIILAIFATAASPPLRPAPFVQCIRQEIFELEPSGETPDIIAIATWAICQEALKKQIEPWHLKGGEIERAVAYAGRQVTPEIISHIVRLRACKKTPRCIAKSLSWEPGLTSQYRDDR